MSRYFLGQVRFFSLNYYDKRKLFCFNFQQINKYKQICQDMFGTLFSTILLLNFILWTNFFSAQISGHDVVSLQPSFTPQVYWKKQPKISNSAKQWQVFRDASLRSLSSSWWGRQCAWSEACTAPCSCRSPCQLSDPIVRHNPTHTHTSGMIFRWKKYSLGLKGHFKMTISVDHKSN